MTAHDYRSPGLVAVDAAAHFPGRVVLDPSDHPWPHLRREVPHRWYADERFPTMGFLNVDEATLLHNIALSFAGAPALEIGAWLGWSTCHLALGGVELDVIDPAHDDPEKRVLVEAALVGCGVRDRVRLHGGSSPASVAEVAAARGAAWQLLFVDGNHTHPGPTLDVLACLPHAAADCAFVFHDLASPDVAAALRLLQRRGFEVAVYQTAQIMAVAWRGSFVPVAHVPDPAVEWQLPPHLADLPVVGVDLLPGTPTGRAELLDVLPGPAAPGPRPKVCVVTGEIIGPFKNGGIGTAMTGLVETLAADGLDVTVLYTGAAWAPDVDLEPWRARYAAQGVTLDSIGFDGASELAGPVREIGLTTPTLVDRYLRARHFDVVHVNDCCGDGGAAILAKRLGIAHRSTVFVLALHSPARWVLEANRMAAETLLPSAFDHFEALSVRNADVVWCPSSYLVGWAAEHGFTFPERTAVHPYVLPTGGEAAPTVTPGPAGPVRELVFFGRLEERKGLQPFCNAVEALGPELAARGISVTFLGKPHTVGGADASTYLRSRTATWPFATRVIPDLGQPEAVAYLRQPGRVAVMPSPVDNSPCTVYEALHWGIPFVAGHTGGIPALVHADDRPRVLAFPDSESLGVALRRVVQDGGWIARPAYDQAQLRADWLTFHERWAELLDPPAPALPGRIAVVVDWQPGTDLEVTLGMLGECPDVLGRVIVLNRTGDPVPDWVEEIDARTEDPDVLGDRIAVLHEAAVLLLHAGVSVDPGRLAPMLAALVDAPCDGLVPSAWLEDREVVTFGGSAPIALVHGATVTGGLVVRREALLQAMAASVPDRREPFLGFAEACVTGAELWPYPEPVLVRPADLGADLTPAVPSRFVRYAAMSAHEQGQVLALRTGRAAPLFARRRELALALADMGLSPLVRIGGRALRRSSALRQTVATWRGR